jgi:hypothetical protein
MARLDYAEGVLWLHLSLLERFGASIKQDFGVLLTAVRQIRVADDPWSELRGLRAPGTAVKGVVALGTRRHSLGRDFVAVYGHGPAVVIELVGVHYAKLVVTAREAESVAAELRHAVAEARVAAGLDPPPTQP